MNTDFGTMLARSLSTAGVSQSRLAAWIDCDHSYISRLVSDQRQPSRDIVDAIIRALKLDGHAAADLLHAAGYLAPHEDAQLRALRDDPTIATVLRILTDPDLPADWITHFRHSIDDLAASSRFVRVRAA